MYWSLGIADVEILGVASRMICRLVSVVGFMVWAFVIYLLKRHQCHEENEAEMQHNATESSII